MKLKKLYLEILFNFAKGTEGILSLSESRARDSFMKPLGDALNDFYKQREAIYQHFCIKNEDGTVKWINGNQYEFLKTDVEAINKELVVLSDEEVDVNFTDNPGQIKTILEKSDYKPKVGEMEVFDQIISQI